MKFAGILTSIVLLSAVALGPAGTAWGQGADTSAADAVILEMKEAFRKSDRKRLAALLPQARGHALEPWAAYWELKARLVDASNDEIRAFLRTYAGTYLGMMDHNATTITRALGGEAPEAGKNGKLVPHPSAD